MLGMPGKGTLRLDWRTQSGKVECPEFAWRISHHLPT